MITDDTEKSIYFMAKNENRLEKARFRLIKAVLYEVMDQSSILRSATTDKTATSNMTLMPIIDAHPFSAPAVSLSAGAWVSVALSVGDSVVASGTTVSSVLSVVPVTT